MTDAKKRRVAGLESLEARQLLTGDFVGVVFNDLTANGINDPSDPKLAGWTVFADTNSDDQFNVGEPKTVTDVKGKFTIAGLPATAITFDERRTASFKPTLGFTNHQTITIREGRVVKSDVPNVTAPVFYGSITGTVFEDDNEDGIKDSGEHGLTGWTMFVSTTADGVKDAGENRRRGVSVYIDLYRDDVHDADEPEAVTGGDGAYSFTGLTPGAYIVREKSGFTEPHTYPTTGGGILWATGVSHAAVGNVTPTSITTSLTKGRILQSDREHHAAGHGQYLEHGGRVSVVRRYRKLHRE